MSDRPRYSSRHMPDDAAFLAAHAREITEYSAFDVARPEVYAFAHLCLPREAAMLGRILVESLSQPSGANYILTKWTLRTIGRSSPEPSPVDWSGLQCVPVALSKMEDAVVVRMPVPEHRTEPYFVAIVAPKLPGKSPVYECYTLELSSDDGRRSAMLCGWSGESGDRHTTYGTGPVPALEAFVAAIRGLRGAG